MIEGLTGFPPDLLLLQAFTGLALGAVYVLLAVGLSLIFGLLGVVNFAHGAFYMVGAYTAVVVVAAGGDFWACLLAAPVLVAGLGLLVGRGRIQRCAFWAKPARRNSALWVNCTVQSPVWGESSAIAG